MNNTDPLAADLNIIGKTLAARAKAQGLTLREISKKTGLSINSVRVVFNGQPGNIATYDKVARILGSSLCDIIASSWRTADKEVKAEALHAQAEPTA